MGSGWYPSKLGLFVLAMAVWGCGPDDGRAQNFAGPWLRHTIDDTLRGADGVRVADVNADGLPDIATGWEQGNVTRAYLHPGYDAVTRRWPTVTVGITPNVEDAVFADIDGDGSMDVVSSCEGSTRKVFVSFGPADPADFLESAAWSTQSFPATEHRHWMFAVPMDVDGKGGIDIVIGGKPGRSVVAWLESPQDGDPRDLSAWRLHEISEAGWVMSIDPVDVNGDGLVDLLVSDHGNESESGVRWLEHPADPADLDRPWENHLIGAHARSPVFIAPVLANDGSLESVVVPSGGERLTRFDRNGSGDDWSAIDMRYGHRLGTPKSAAVGDIDLDGALDVVVACTNLSGWDQGIVWYAEAAADEEEAPTMHSISGAQGEKFDRLELIDLDGDGDLDVLTTEEVQQFGVIWYENPRLSAQDITTVP